MNQEEPERSTNLAKTRECFLYPSRSESSLLFSGTILVDMVGDDNDMVPMPCAGFILLRKQKGDFMVICL